MEDIKKEEIISIFKCVCERCLLKGMIETLEDAKKMYDVFNRFRINDYNNDEEYSSDILYLYNLSVKLHSLGYTSLEESYSIYNAILCADRIDFVEVNKPVIDKTNGVKIKRTKKVEKEDNSVIDISDISL